MLLANGKMISYGPWKIEVGPDDANVLVLYHDNKITVDANRPCKLTFPVSGKFKGKVVLKSIDTLESHTFSANVQRSKRQKSVEFELSALKNTTLKIIYLP
jgi:hypothetical protein